jgi:muramoyltetrapeptide carboxypeptidase
MIMKLKIGDEVRVIAPSRSMNILSDDVINRAKAILEGLGLKVTFGKNVMQYDKDFGCASIKQRVSDLHEAFLDENVKAILTVIGGYNINQILDYIDYNVLKANPKVLCGFSDITALQNAIYAKTKMITFYGPHFSSFGMKKGLEYTVEGFKNALFKDGVIDVTNSTEYSDDKWYIDQENRTFIPNEGMVVINDGNAEGTIIGGNLCTFNLLQGTKYMPSLKNSILFIEDDDLSGEVFMQEFDRNLESLTQIEDFSGVRGIIIGRAQTGCKMTIEKWKKIIKSKEKLNNIPVIVNADFGHTTPIFTFPIGGKCNINITNGNINIEISEK